MARKQQQQESGSQLSRGTRSKVPQHQRSMTCTATNSIGLSSSAEQMHFGQSQPIHSLHVTNPTNASIQYLQQTHDQTATTLDGIFNGSHLNQNQQSSFQNTFSNPNNQSYGITHYAGPQVQGQQPLQGEHPDANQSVLAELNQLKLHMQHL